MVKVAVDKATGEVRAAWDDREEAHRRAGIASSDASTLSVEPECPAGCEVVEMPEHTLDSFNAEADRKASLRAERPVRAGRMRLSGPKGKEVEADPPEEAPADTLEELMLARKGKRRSAPLTWGDLDEARDNREKRGSRSRGRT